MLLSPSDETTSGTIHDAVHAWKAGDRALVLYSYGGIGGKKREPAAATSRLSTI